MFCLLKEIDLDSGYEFVNLKTKFLIQIKIIKNFSTNVIIFPYLKKL